VPQGHLGSELITWQGGYDQAETDMKMLVAMIIGFLEFAAPCHGHGSELEESVLARPVVIGASISAGLSAGNDFSQVLEVMLECDHQPIDSAFSVLFWRDPVRTGEFQTRFALEKRATVLIAIDFLFWFGYAARNINGDPLSTEEERMELLDYGLELLGSVSCPIVLGDIPRYQRALGRTVLPARSCSSETLQKLNQRLRSWAKERGNVIVLPLAEKLEAIYCNEQLIVGGYACPNGMTQRLLHSDRVHPTLEGLIWISYLLTTEIVAREWVEGAEVGDDLFSVFERLQEGGSSKVGATSRFVARRFEEQARRPTVFPVNLMRGRLSPHP